MNIVRTIGDLNEARSQPWALVFPWVDWSIQGTHAEHTLRTFLGAWEAQIDGCTVAAYSVDLSSQAGEVWDATRAWLAAAPL
jgi:hypothetical protein